MSNTNPEMFNWLWYLLPRYYSPQRSSLKLNAEPYDLETSSTGAFMHNLCGVLLRYSCYLIFMTIVSLCEPFLEEVDHEKLDARFVLNNDVMDFSSLEKLDEYSSNSYWIKNGQY